MVKVLLYGYATGVFSSRRIARKLEEDVGFRVLAAGNFPQHRTLCEFRRRYPAAFQALFVEVVRVAQELGVARLGKLSIDEGACEREQAQGDELRPDAGRGTAPGECWRAPECAGFSSTVDNKVLWSFGAVEADSVRVCSPPSRRVAALRPRFAGLTALTAAPRTLVQTGLRPTAPQHTPLHVVVDDLFGLTFLSAR